MPTHECARGHQQAADSWVAGCWMLVSKLDWGEGRWGGDPTITLAADGDTMVVVMVVRNLADSTCLSIADYRLQSAYAQDFTPHGLGSKVCEREAFRVRK